MTHRELVERLQDMDALVDVTGGHLDRPNFHLDHKPYLHFHKTREGEIYADVKLRGPRADFEPVWAATPADREALIRRVQQHLRALRRR